MDYSTVESTYGDIIERKAYIPDNYISSRVECVGTGPAITPHEIFEGIKRYPPAPLWRIQSETKSFYTPRPITVKIYREEDTFFAENENLIVCGTGESPQEAVSDLCLHIIHFYEYYKGLEKENLIGDALRLKDLYSNLLIEK